MGMGRALAGLEQRLEAHQVDAPLGAAVVHELHRFPPAFVREQDDRCSSSSCRSSKVTVVPSHSSGPSDHGPQHPLARIELAHLHVDPPRRNRNQVHAAEVGITRGVAGPPAGEPVERRERGVHLVGRLPTSRRPCAGCPSVLPLVVVGLVVWSSSVWSWLRPVGLVVGLTSCAGSLRDPLDASQSARPRSPPPRRAGPRPGRAAPRRPGTASPAPGA